MLEIFLIIYLSKKIGTIVEEKGRKKGWYIALFVISWIVFEVLGIIIGGMIFSEEMFFAPYLLALVGAGIAYLLNYSYVNSLSDESNSDFENDLIIK